MALLSDRALTGSLENMEGILNIRVAEVNCFRVFCFQQRRILQQRHMFGIMRCFQLSRVFGSMFSCCCVHRPNLIDMGLVYRQSNQENLEQAFSVAERELGVTRLLDPEGEGRHRTTSHMIISPLDIY